MKVDIYKDTDSEMIRIDADYHCVFEGNYWDLPDDSAKFKMLFEKMGFDVEVKNYKYEE